MDDLFWHACPSVGGFDLIAALVTMLGGMWFGRGDLMPCVVVVLIATRRESLKWVQLSGPTLFAPVINQVRFVSG